MRIPWTGNKLPIFADASHEHAGSDITSGTVYEKWIDADIARDSEIMPAVLDSDGPGSGLNADYLDNYTSGSFVRTTQDYGRSGVSPNLYEGTTSLSVKYVNESGDVMSGNTTGWLFDVTNTGTGYGIDSSAQHLALRGAASSSSGTGVRGNASGASGYGVYGYASGNTGRGVYGTAVSTGDYLNYGGYFSAAGEDGRGVYGYASKTGDVINYGGYFQARGDSGRPSTAMPGAAVAVALKPMLLPMAFIQEPMAA